MSQHFDALDELVHLRNQIVTYRYLSRLLGLHVNEAKKLLHDYCLRPTQKLTKPHALYCLTGHRRRAGQKDEDANPNAEEFAILVIPEEDLEKTKNSFTRLSGVHVYSVAASRPTEEGQIVAVNRNLPSNENKNNDDYGIIQNDQIHILERKKIKQTAPQASTSKTAAASKAPVAQNPTLAAVGRQGATGSSAGLTAAATSSTSSTGKRAAEKSGAQANKKKPTKASFFGAVKPKTKVEPKAKTVVPETEPDDEDNEESDEEERDRRLALSSAAANAANEDLEIGEGRTQEEDEKGQRGSKISAKAKGSTATTTTKRAAKTYKSKNASSAKGDETREDEDGSETEASRSLRKQQQESLMAEMGKMDTDEPMSDRSKGDEDDNAEKTEGNREDPAEDATKSPSRTRKRGRRKVVKQKTFKNARGYIVTEDVAEWESFSENDEEETVRKPAAKKQAVEKNEPTRSASSSSADVAPAGRDDTTSSSPTKSKPVARTSSAGGLGKKKNNSGGQQQSLLSFFKKG